MKKLTAEEQAILMRCSEEISSLLCDDQDYEGASIKGMIADYVDVKCNPSNSIKDNTIYHCKTPIESMAFLNECQNNGFFFIINAGTTITVTAAFDMVDDFQEGIEFVLAPTEDKILMDEDLKKGRENLPVIEFKVSEGD